jgi:putative membrane protein
MKKKIILTTATISAIALPTIAAAYNGYCDGPGFGGYHMGAGGFFGGGIFMLITTFLLIGLAVFFGIKYFKNDKTSITNSALEVARTRFAKGEISNEEFQIIKTELQ